jgi:hypothetical protein
VSGLSVRTFISALVAASLACPPFVSAAISTHFVPPVISAAVQKQSLRQRWGKMALGNFAPAGLRVSAHTRFRIYKGSWQ